MAAIERPGELPLTRRPPSISRDFRRVTGWVEGKKLAGSTGAPAPSKKRRSDKVRNPQSHSGTKVKPCSNTLLSWLARMRALAAGGIDQHFPFAQRPGAGRAQPVGRPAADSHKAPRRRFIRPLLAGREDGFFDAQMARGCQKQAISSTPLRRGRTRRVARRAARRLFNCFRHLAGVTRKRFRNMKLKRLIN